MKNTLKKLTRTSTIILGFILLSCSAGQAQDFKYQTKDHQFKIKMTPKGNSWAIFTSEKEAKWLGSKLLSCNNKKGYYKVKLHKTGKVVEIWLSRKNIMTVKELAPNGKKYNKTYYPY